jgi:hypothetical protein
MSEEVLDEHLDEEVLETTEEQESPEAESTEEVAEYTPNYSYKVKDEEFEFDEFLRAGISNPEQEEALRELYTKSRGLDGYKDKLSSREREYNELMGEAGTYVDGFKTLKKHVDHANQTGDFREVGKALGLSEEKLLEYAYGLAKESELPDDQRNLLNQNRELQDQLQSVESRMKQFESQQHTSDQEKEMLYVKQCVESIPDGMDVYHAMKENNRDMIKEFYWMGEDMIRCGQDPKIPDIIGRLVNDNRGLLELKRLREGQQQQQQVQADIGQKPTLPTVKGNNTAAVVKEVSSIDDLKRIHQAMVNT